jgi:hypothetical protein
MAAMRTPAAGKAPTPSGIADCIQYVLKGGMASPARLILAMKRVSTRADQRARCVCVPHLSVLPSRRAHGPIDARLYRADTECPSVCHPRLLLFALPQTPPPSSLRAARNPAILSGVRAVVDCGVCGCLCLCLRPCRGLVAMTTIISSVALPSLQQAAIVLLRPAFGGHFASLGDKKTPVGAPGAPSLTQQPSTTGDAPAGRVVLRRRARLCSPMWRAHAVSHACLGEDVLLMTHGIRWIDFCRRLSSGCMATWESLMCYCCCCSCSCCLDAFLRSVDILFLSTLVLCMYGDVGITDVLLLLLLLFLLSWCIPCTMHPSGAGAGAGAGSSADNAECSFVKDGPSKAQQQLYQCTTCSDGKGRAVCKSCAEVCHAGHRLSPPRSELGVCSCGSLGGCAALSKSRRLTTPGPPPSSTVPLGRGGSTPTSGEH